MFSRRRLIDRWMERGRREAGGKWLRSLEVSFFRSRGLESKGEEEGSSRKMGDDGKDRQPRQVGGENLLLSTPPLFTNANFTRALSIVAAYRGKACFPSCYRAKSGKHTLGGEGGKAFFSFLCP